ncbi:ABC transporter substrate-binding protein [Heliobacillus mobilis]|uniref:ABC transporter substrate-binding protein n=1 Tax=Heliobacterium mobile TaxID=28064 RepID=A0A6I3SHR5_HELMO|nr:ABC transporter substrate-binding protein [Heliobacterium mobile]
MFFRENYTAGGGVIVADEKFISADQDFSVVLAKIQESKPDIIYLPAYYEPVAEIVKQARLLKMTTPFIGSNGWDSPRLVELAGKENVNNCFFTNHFIPDDPDPAVQSFVNAYRARYNQTPDTLAALGYDSLKIIADAIKRANSDDPITIKDAIASTRDFRGITGKLSFNEYHNPSKEIVSIEFKDGKQSFNSKITAK